MLRLCLKTKSFADKRSMERTEAQEHPNHQRVHFIVLQTMETRWHRCELQFAPLGCTGKHAALHLRQAPLENVSAYFLAVFSFQKTQISVL